MQQTRLLALPPVDWKAREAEALGRLDRAIAAFRPGRVFVAFSGGDDSLTAATIASLHPRVDSVFHIDTQTGAKATREFVEAASAKLGLSVTVGRSSVDYEDLCARFGLLGGGRHRVYYNALKGRAFRQLGYDAAWPPYGKKAAPILLVSGARADESKKRQKTVKTEAKRDAFEKRIVWLSIVGDWSKIDCLRYLEYRGLERSPLSSLLHRSAECNCPAYLSKDEYRELELWAPDAAIKVQRGSDAAKAAGKWWKIGVPCPPAFEPDAASLAEFDADLVEAVACSDCPHRRFHADKQAVQKGVRDSPSGLDGHRKKDRKNVQERNGKSPHAHPLGLSDEVNGTADESQHNESAPTRRDLDKETGAV